MIRRIALFDGRIRAVAPVAALFAVGALVPAAGAGPLPPQTSAQVFVVEDYENPAGEQTLGTALCPPKARVTGGGVYGGTLEDPDDARFGTFEQSINSSYPVLGLGLNSEQDGWYGIMNNAGTHLNRMLVFAICDTR